MAGDLRKPKITGTPFRVVLLGDMLIVAVFCGRVACGEEVLLLRHHSSGAGRRSGENRRGNEKRRISMICAVFRNLAERTGLEPATPGVTGRYSNQLNYRSKFVMFSDWWVLRGSNSRPTPCKGAALPTELSPHTVAYPQRHIRRLSPRLKRPNHILFFRPRARVFLPNRQIIREFPIATAST